MRAHAAHCRGRLEFGGMALRKAPIGNITMGDSLYHCGHGETAPLRGLFSSLTWAASVPPRRPHLLCASTVRAKKVTQPWAAANPRLKTHRWRRADNALCPAEAELRRVYRTRVEGRRVSATVCARSRRQCGSDVDRLALAKDTVTKCLDRRHQRRSAR